MTGLDITQENRNAAEQEIASFEQRLDFAGLDHNALIIRF